MTKGNDIGLVMLKYTPPNDLIETIREQVRIVPKTMLHHVQKFGPILSPSLLTQLASDEIVHYVSKPWCGIMSNVHQLLIRESF
jgi:hypothetical protein